MGEGLSTPPVARPKVSARSTPGRFRRLIGEMETFGLALAMRDSPQGDAVAERRAHQRRIKM
jgi:hypothetical protein